MSRRWVASVGVLAFVAASGVARAAGLLPLPDIRTSHRVTQKYTCATGRILQVTYLNATNGQSFAVLPVKGRQMLFVNVLSGSGAKYQAGSYTWWTKGPQATLYDAMLGEDAPPLLSDCVTIVR
ncbi:MULTISPECIES: MliC family protein [Paraburkholderia]|jgi:membrane-bound inhibitor of C-type lysozyme|uniref:Transcriptional regulator n=1 Tax=Paraburkholderia hospita TaxID=169430 RepID=A0AAJ4T036_9BURK|nr:MULTISPECIES: MliC family protein [Paraburkholderia]SOE66174.1 Membrane-bound inhibitor of C-type lysozyme [Burkholderia sp. YR290]AUT70261.1 transcriptional regulator [Paraburkholderia hospita]AXF00283.1 transcriptional regulator [Paraburkholderia hospita]MDW3657728.1 MliC family protein [Paraburkholderia terrae]OUL69649.1 transcriptional regulator [Paraburkholderia hospita]